MLYLQLIAAFTLLSATAFANDQAERSHSTVVCGVEILAGDIGNGSALGIPSVISAEEAEAASQGYRAPIAHLCQVNGRWVVAFLYPDRNRANYALRF